MYIFQKDGSIIKSINGKINYSTYTYMQENESIIIKDENQYMIKLKFYSEFFTILQKEGQEGYIILISETFYDNFNDGPDKIKYILNKEIEHKAKRLKKKLTYSFLQKLITKIAFGFLSFLILHIIFKVLGLFDNVPEHLLLSILGLYIGCSLLIIASVNIIVNKVCKHNDEISIQEWKTHHPNSPLSKHL